ncbi:MAG: hypothetical protein WDO18_03550 [Acidobacteriota bacterium]
MNDNQNRNLDRVLGKHLGPVRAPEDLWTRVQNPGQRVPVHTRSMWGAWAAAAAMLVFSAGGWMVWQERHPVSVESLAVEALAQGPENLALHTEDASEVRAWVKSHAGIDIPLPPKHSPLVRILGASISRDSRHVAEVSYQVGDYRAALIVARDESGKTVYPQHELRSSDPVQAARVSSWSMKGQSYTLAWAAPGEFRVACLLCHGTEPAMIQMPSI